MKTILAYFFGVIVFLRNFLFNFGILRINNLPGKVVSVGNIAVGGTGKSPTVIALASELISNNYKVVILTRGYKGGLARSDWMVLLNGNKIAGNAKDSANPDEALMQSKELKDVPVVVGANRYKNALKWLEVCKSTSKLELNSLVWILDDGFQHRAIHRDLDIVLLDSKRPFGALMPKGLFREATESLSRADVVLFTRADHSHPQKGDFSFVSAVNPKAYIAKVKMFFDNPLLASNSFEEVDSSHESLQSKRFMLVAGIANPDQFIAAVLSKGLTIVSKKIQGDHESFELDSLLGLVSSCDCVITTAKDFARNQAVFEHLGRPVYVLPMRTVIPKDLLERLWKPVANWGKSDSSLRSE
jgi:tetraacyldisaccharide 4'-kinase